MARNTDFKNLWRKKIKKGLQTLKTWKNKNKRLKRDQKRSSSVTVK